MDKHNELYKKASKYKRMRHGNPDVDLYFDHYNRYKYEIENAHFDIAVSNIFSSMNGMNILLELGF